MLKKEKVLVSQNGWAQKCVDGGNTMIHIFSWRDKGPQGHSIKEMSDGLSKDELYEMAKLRGRDVGIVACHRVNEQLARIKENKKSGRVEHGTHEHLTIDFFDLTGIIYDGGSRVITSGDERSHWRIEIQGGTQLGAILRVFVHLYKETAKPLSITDFQQIFDA
jgi:hypothetical protein